MTNWPGKIWLTLGAVIAVVASGLLWRRWRSAPVVVGCFAAAALFLWPALRYGPDAGGLKIAGLPFGMATAALVVVALMITAWLLWRLASSPRLPRWVRFIPAALALYAIALIVFGLVRGAPPAGVLSGEGRLPYWLSGPYLGSAVLIPLGLLAALVALGIALARKRTGVISAVAVMAMMLSAFVLSGLALTRNGRPNLAQFIVPASFVGASSSIGPQVTASSSGTVGVLGTLGAGEESLAPYEGKDLDEIFARVATGVRYEPYSGILRGAIGTAVARSGNAADQSMLLAEVLRRAGYKVRYARGTLADNNIDAVIEGMYPPGVVDPKLEPDYVPYNPTADAALRDAVRAHMWVEVFQGSTWLPLDPSFPRAKVGETYAAAVEQFEKPADALYQTLQATLREETQNGQVRELSRFRLNVADVGFKPITLVVRSIPQAKTEGPPKAAAGAPFGGMGGALSGETETKAPEPKKVAEKIVGVAYVRTLTIGNSPEKVARTTVLDAEPQTALRREWIEFNLGAPDNPARRIERVLYQSDGNGRPADHRTYTISVIPGRITRAFADQQTRLARTLIDPESMQKRARSASGISPDDPKADALAIELEAMAIAAGTVGGHLLALRFAVESDSISRLIADGSGVALAWAVPRILIAGVEVAGKDKRIDAKVSLDLRLDEVKAYPYRGAPTRMTNVFQAARGIQESVIEGGLIAVATGRDETANTAQLMRAAEEAKVPLLVINSSTRSMIPELIAGLPAACVQLMEAALTQGREIVVPSRAVALAGGPQFGWWEVDPSSGAIVGVMQDGEHQGMVEYSVGSQKIGLNDKTGRVLGMIVGSITTLGTLSALLLEYGDVTPALIKRLEDYVKQVMCISCFDKAEASVKAAAGGACLKEDLRLKAGIGAKVGFCDNYYKGFKCSASLIVSNLKKENFKQFVLTAEIGASAAVGCDPLFDAKYSGPGK